MVNVRSILVRSIVPTVFIASAAFAQTGPEKVVLTFTNLAPLDEAGEGHYEGWAILGGVPVSTGNFNMDGAGNPVGLGGGGVITEFDAGQDITAATDIKITIEPPGDADPAPSGLVIVGGVVSGSSAVLAAEVPGLAMLSGSATGSFILATPSDNGVDTTNDDEGIWFLSTPGPVAGLTNLPAIGPKWTYEGWAVDLTNPGSPVPYSTGTFSTASGVDSDAAGCAGGGPPFPGQDFTAFHCDAVLDLDSGNFAAVISIEPVPDTGPGPFQLKPLAGPIGTNALGMNNAIGNQTSATFPVGTAQLMDVVSVEAAGWGDVKAMYR